MNERIIKTYIFLSHFRKGIKVTVSMRDRDIDRDTKTYEGLGGHGICYIDP